ncbi:MAG: hypothetical protein LBH57_00750 [Treponema sp.]|nr:hypothetical protein [Treponema sp.]
MKKEQEEKYYARLNTIINQYNRSHANHAVTPDEHYTSSLAEFIITFYPRLTRNLLNGSVYTVPKTPFSDRIVPAIINAANKGTVVSVRDAQGKLKIYANAGKDDKSNKKRVLVLDGHERDAAKNNYLYLLAYRILKDDIRYVSHNEKYFRVKSFASPSPELPAKRNTVTAKGKFERRFKALIRKQGTGSSPALTARYIFAAMTCSDKRKLNASLKTMGVATGTDMVKLLQRWKAEALRENPLPRHTPSRELAGYGR